MPATVDKLTTEQLQRRVAALALQVRQRRKVLGVTVQTAAQAAGMSRDTWQRMEKGGVSVTIGAWFNALSVLGLEFGVGIGDESAPAAAGSIPVTVRLADYPQLAALAWQVQGATAIPARAAYDIYQRNARHIDREKLTGEEAALIHNLAEVFGGSADV